MKHRLFVYGACLALFVLLVEMRASGTTVAPGDNDRNLDLHCGPRCIEYLMEHYGFERPDLRVLIAEVSGDEASQGATLHAIQQYLNSRNVHTLAIHHPSGCIPDWSHPVLLHLRSSANRPGGHYVILLPGKSRTRKVIWDGLRGTLEIPSWQLTDESSGVALLTSMQPIPDDTDVCRLTADSIVRRTATSTLIMTIALVTMPLLRAGRRRAQLRD